MRRVRRYADAMTTLVFTIVGADRAGLVARVADIVADHDGNWERSELAELSGTFAGVVEVSVPAARADDLKTALSALEGLLTAVVQEQTDAATEPMPARPFTFTVLGNDRPGIVREITAVLGARDMSIDRMTTVTREAAMYGGRLFEASVVAHASESVDVDSVIVDLERLAGEIQVDVSVGG